LELIRQQDHDPVFAIIFAVLSAVLRMAVLVAVGAKLQLQGFMDGSKRQCLAGLSMDICLPCLLFCHVLPEADAHLLYSGWPLLLWPFVYSFCGAICGLVCCLLVGIPFQHLGAAAACAAFPNVNSFPIGIITALGPAVPCSPFGVSPLTFLSLVQLTDGLVKYTVGPAIFRRDLRASNRRKSGNLLPPLPIGASLLSISSSGTSTPIGVDGSIPLLSEKKAMPTLPPVLSASLLTASVDEEDSASEDGSEMHRQLSPTLHHSGAGSTSGKNVTDFGLYVEQVRAVEPEWSRWDSYMLLLRRRSSLVPMPGDPRGWKKLGGQCLDFLRKLIPPQVLAVLTALTIGLIFPSVKAILVAPVSQPQPPLNFFYGAMRQLGDGFMPLQMIALGGRLVNVAGPSGPLAPGGAAGPRGRERLVLIAAAVSVARMVLAPAASYFVAILVNQILVQISPGPLPGGTRPLAFWAPALIVASCPTANNMSTMADLVGSGRSISSASTAMQLLISPLVLAFSLTLLMIGAQSNLAPSA